MAAEGITTERIDDWERTARARRESRSPHVLVPWREVLQLVEAARAAQPTPRADGEG